MNDKKIDTTNDFLVGAAGDKMAGMRIYVAGAGAEREIVKGYIAKLREAGIEITLDWTKDVDANAAKCKRCDATLDKHQPVDDGLGPAALCPDGKSLFAPMSDRDLSDADRAAFARKDIEKGILPADVVWLLIDPKAGVGCFIEFGYALALNTKEVPRHIFVSGDIKRSIFTALADVCVADHEEAFAQIVELSKGASR